MNVEQWINVVKVVLDKARPVDSGLYCLVVVDKELHLIPKRKLKTYQKPLATFTSIDVNLGPTSGRWWTVGYKLAAQIDLNPELKK